ncbi:MAG: DUF1992 domain-containing protein [Propionibacteriaceae bacterium]|jgi:hypothetical protein|nr:DUF1992 domain-containing protein [Propionibacteriaceae bacterium]
MDEPTVVYEGFVERKLREALASGAFDDLPGSGKPLRLRYERDPDWWLRSKIEDEHLDVKELFRAIKRG